MVNKRTLEDIRNDRAVARSFPLLHPKSDWYRVILDEAQCIKNKNTQSSKAAAELKASYRWCLTGTPMMNSVQELFSLIRFLRIRPYNDHRAFQHVRSLYPAACVGRKPN